MPTRTWSWLLLALLWLPAAPASAETRVRVVDVSAPQRLSEREKAAIRQYSIEDYRESVRKTAEHLPPEQREALLKALEAMPPGTFDPKAQAAAAEATHYEILLENTSGDHFVRRVRLEVRYLAGGGVELGRGSQELDVRLRPHEPERVRFDCHDEACVKAAALEVLAVVPVAVSSYKDRWVRFRDRTWHVAYDWQTEGRVSVYPFSPGYYDKKPHNPRIFAPGTLSLDLSVEGSYDERFFKLLRPVPASKPYPENDIRWMMAAGLIIKDGEPVRRNPFREFFSLSGHRILDGVESVDLPAGEFVRLDAYSERDGDDLGFFLHPVCQPRRGRLNSWLYFRLGKHVFKNHDTEAAEARVRRWLVPASPGEVARVCGPVSGTLILHLTVKSGEKDVLLVLGRPEARREDGGVVELIYGEMRLRFSSGAFAGVRFAP